MQHRYDQSSVFSMTAAAAYVVQLVIVKFAHVRGLVFLKLIEVGICFLIGNISVLLNGHFLEFFHGISFLALHDHFIYVHSSTSPKLMHYLFM